MSDLPDLLHRLRRMSMVRSVEVVRKRHVRVETRFVYPDGAFVDVFIVNGASRPPLPWVLSDLGQTMDFLLHHDVKPWSSKKRAVQLADAIALYGATLRGAALEVPVVDVESSLQDGIILLGQACLRMSDLLFTKRLQLQGAFADEVEEFLSDAELEYTPNVELQGPFAPVAVDFLVRGRSKSSAVMVLSARLSTAAHAQANEVFRKVHDLATAGASEQRVALLDDTGGFAQLYRDDDIGRIQTYATLMPFSERDELRTLLAA